MLMLFSTGSPPPSGRLRFSGFSCPVNYLKPIHLCVQAPDIADGFGHMTWNDNFKTECACQPMVFVVVETRAQGFEGIPRLPSAWICE